MLRERKERERAMADFPDDLMRDIMFRLPVKSLLRFRCVSKQWCALIDSKQFIKQHLNHSLLTKTTHTLFFQHTHICSLKLHQPKKVLKMVQPVNPKKPAVELLGSCNGLLCLLYRCTDHIVVIWNPNTRKHVNLPPYVTYDERLAITKYILVYGFGYDSVSDDYKVVRLLQFFVNDDIGFVSETNVFSMRSGSWRIIDDVPVGFVSNKQGPGALVRGKLNWVAAKLLNFQVDFWLVVAFDVVTEEYTTVALPDFPLDKVASLFLSELGGCLSFVSEHVVKQLGISVGLIDVWVMKEYGVKESWTKFLTLSTSEISRNIITDVIPLAYSESGDELALLLNSEELLYYNLENKTFKFVDIRCGHGYFNPPMLCLESLVSLGGKAENDEKQGGVKKQVKKDRQEKFLSVGFKLVL